MRFVERVLLGHRRIAESYERASQAIRRQLPDPDPSELNMF